MRLEYLLEVVLIVEGDNGEVPQLRQLAECDRERPIGGGLEQRKRPWVAVAVRRYESGVKAIRKLAERVPEIPSQLKWGAAAVRCNDAAHLSFTVRRECSLIR